jgi:dTDP-4-dehydrorhamnose 3,5-epimerase
MEVTPLSIPDVLLLAPKVFGDDRGYFFESFNAKKFTDIIGRNVTFVQDNQSRSTQAVLRGLHYQVAKPQGKLVRVTQGTVFDVAVDIRKNSPTFGRWVGELLSADNHRQLWIPEGFAHGFLVMSDFAVFQYKVTDYWYPEHERCIRYDDPDIGIQWPLTLSEPSVNLTLMLSQKDNQGTSLKKAELL